MSKLSFPPAETLTLADGRTLGYTVYGDAGATSRTVFYQHGFPGSRYEAATWDAGALRHGIRLVAADRPGCGASTNQPNRTLLDWPADILALASHLGAVKFAILGVSGGGPYTLALLHALPATQCAGAAVVAGLYPHALGLADLPLTTQALMRLAPWSTWAVSKILDVAVGSTARRTDNDDVVEKSMTDTIAGRGVPADTAIWEADPDIRAMLVASVRESLRAGCDGGAWDACAYADWRFGLEDVQVGGGPGQQRRLVLWHGAQDANVPIEQARRAAPLLRGAETRFYDDEGHLSIVAHKADEVLEVLGRMLDGGE